MSKKVPPKGDPRRAGSKPSLTSKPAKRAALAKKAGRHVTADKVTSCFDGAGDLNPTKTRVGQPKKR
jgi:hypothetical protein